MTVDQFRPGHHGSRNTGRPAESLIDRLAAGEQYAISFGGQGGPWLSTLAELVVDADLEQKLAGAVAVAERMLAPVADSIEIARPDGFHPLAWVRAADAGEPVPSDAELADFAVEAMLERELVGTGPNATIGDAVDARRKRR